MGRKYLGEKFDIHGGGMDLLFPHHESEIAQSQIANGAPPCRYWMHNNMITINGQKMGKSLGNAIMLNDFFKGTHPLLEQSYSPMSIRFFILQAHYRSALDFSNAALQAAEKGMNRLLKACDTLNTLKPSKTSSVDSHLLEKNYFDALDDDLNTPIAISVLFDGVRAINSVNEGKETMTKEDIETLKKLYATSLFDILGLKKEEKTNHTSTGSLIKLLLDIRQKAKVDKDFATADKIRDELISQGITVKDTKDGTVWEI
jgi:cysteinyl-tRNA synthetase